ncbi:two-component system sensor histidine kinase NtrB [Hyalangium sp.]|uniref:two-component system sensor histidine kinase NtrB n=1 Tax=Hyalangium sp. TaxID=2028555 RepID=UPI002D26ED38|nr:ATP-binding protein [Hyalangium sp.]HYH98396.1 ATP-binding protein [Hyalangium sp.]
MRHTLVPILLLCVALASVGVGVLAVIQRSRAELVQQFARDRQAQLDEATRGVIEAVEDVSEDLLFAGELLSQPGTPEEHRRELRALLEVIGQYKVIAAYDEAGGEQLRLVDRRADPLVLQGKFLPELMETARRALERPPGDITSSPPLAGVEGGWLRILATAIPSEGGPARGAVAVLVDTQSLFAPLRIVTSDPEARLLLIGAHGRPSPAGDAGLASWYQRLEQEQGLVPMYAALASKMRAGERGTLLISEHEAELLGLGKAEAVAAFTSIPLKGGSHWSAATLVSTIALRSHERGLIVRLSLAALLVTLFLVGFGVYVFLAQRRAVALRESRRHADRLAHLHDKTQKILDNIPTGVLALTAEGRISAVNQVLRARMPSSVAGAPLAAAFPQASEPVVTRLQGLVEAATREARVRSLLGEPLALFGEEGQYSIHAVPLEARDPEVRTLLVVEDLSNVRALETQLLRAEKFATVGVLAAGIAHEIGTPLGVVRGRAEYVLGKLGAVHPQAAGVGVIIEQIDRVSRTLRQLLDFSRLQPAAVRPVALGPLLRDVSELLRLEAERRQVRIDWELPEGLPAIAADPDQLQQVLVNLTLNACDACSVGGRVRLTAAAPDGSSSGAWGFVTLTVQDDGCGIPPESLNQVFDPFFTTKKRGQGTGLGLTVVAHVVRNHGGRVELESEPGRGTCVTLLWPAAGPSAAAEQHVS